MQSLGVEIFKSSFVKGKSASRGFLQEQLVEAVGGAAAGCVSLRATETFFSPLLQLFEHFYFGEVQLDAVRLSQRFSTDASGYYATSGQLNFC